MSDSTLVWANEGGRRMTATGGFEELSWLGHRSSEKGGGAMLFEGNDLRMVFVNGTAFWPTGQTVSGVGNA